MTESLSTTNRLLESIRGGKEMSRSTQFNLLLHLALPAMLAQLATIMMNYIDASMVGGLGGKASASVGLMNSSMWLFGGLCMSVANGFGVQVAHLIGSNDFAAARNVLRQSLMATLCFSLTLSIVGLLIAPHLPLWLGGDKTIVAASSAYFTVFSSVLPILQINLLSTAMLRCSGNIKVPSMLNATMCCLDVIFNFFLIYPTRWIHLGGYNIHVPGAGLGVVGAALGTASAMLVTATIMLSYLVFISKDLHLYHHGFGALKRFVPTQKVIYKAIKISVPMAFQHAAICSAQILTIVIVAPLGIYAIAANSFGITAESICYMPGYGLSDAATTLVGQSLGAGRKQLAKQFAFLAVGSGMFVMGVMGIFLYFGANFMMHLFTNVPEIIALGVRSLHIEAFAEPMFAASIVAYGCCVGAGNTLKPALMNLGSTWGIRLTLAFFLAPTYGLPGVWTAMAIELCFRGIIFLIHLGRGKWLQL